MKLLGHYIKIVDNIIPLLTYPTLSHTYTVCFVWSWSYYNHNICGRFVVRLSPTEVQFEISCLTVCVFSLQLMSFPWPALQLGPFCFTYLACTRKSSLRAHVSAAPSKERTT